MSSFQRRIMMLGLALLLAATASWGYILVFKDGETLVIEGPYRMAGDKVAVTLPSGAETEFPVADVDLEKTNEMNKVARGAAVVLDRRQEEGTAPPEERSLADLMRDRRPAQHAPAAAAEPEAPRTLRRTPAGNVDFFSIPKRPLARREQIERINGVLRLKGLRSAEIYQGTSSKRVLIDVVTATRGEVFAALEGTAAALLEVRLEMPEIEAFELAMATSSRSRAGQFVLTPEDAQRLVSGSVTPAEHFVAHVLF